MSWNAKNVHRFHAAHPERVVVDVLRVYPNRQRLLRGIRDWDPFQAIGIPCHVSPAFLDDPNEPGYPFADNH